MDTESGKRMVLIEEDKDVAACVTGFFSDRFDVIQVGTLKEALKALRGRTAELLFANIDSASPEQASTIEQIHRDHPDMKIVVSHLSPMAGESWQRLRKCVDVFVRKPYRLVEVDKAMRALDKKQRTQS